MGVLGFWGAFGVRAVLGCFRVLLGYFGVLCGLSVVLLRGFGVFEWVGVILWVSQLRYCGILVFLGFRVDLCGA